MLLYKLRRRLFALFMDANPLGLLVVALAYIILSYLLLVFAGEQDLTSPDVFLYWLVVTASTVGYGDYSPSTFSGRLITSFFVIPVGLSLFAVCVGKVGFYISEILTKGKKGLRMSRASNHCIIIGWNGARTMRLINLLRCEQNSRDERILLVNDQAMDNPLPAAVDYVQVDGFTDPNTMVRANLGEASRIIIDTPLDDVTLSTALFCHRQNENAHITVYFKDEAHEGLLKSYCPSVEVVPSVSIEMLARASLDPGSASLHQCLLDPAVDASQFSMVYSAPEPTAFGELISRMRTRHQAIAIAVKKADADKLDINPPDSSQIIQGDIVYYIADNRIDGL
ncbi:potassium channel family protein [Teredinibacter turnerae]|uniref:potassium channel family protein n=1 Tax=Teredinibacter turnerae TaxID=2426 RepID=UPI000371FF7B|nr:potassium channel family protein [Teredinibacter turnerae]